MTEYDPIKFTNIPGWLRLVMLFIDRVGFPVLAFILLFFVCFVSIDKATSAIQDNTKALVLFTTQSTAFQQRVVTDHVSLDSGIRRCETILNGK